MTPAAWASLAPGLLALILHVPAWIRGTGTARRVDRIERPRPPQALRGVHSDRGLGPVVYSFRNLASGLVVQTVDETQALRLIEDPEWAQL
jgi:hypothetical protein